MISIVVRKLEVEDFERGYLKILSQLSNIDINTITKEQILNFMNNLSSNINIFVLVDSINNKIIGSGTLLIEQKIIHNFGKVGHIEDIVVDSNYRGEGYGKQIIEYLVDYARQNQCYKVILVSNDHNSTFYNKLGFSKKDNSMALYF
jgi:glucosamine-phosphate N-acetyltransferase